MGRRKVGSLLTLVGAVAALNATNARADDWPQFRHDERRTAASTDRLQLPLTDIWSMTGHGLVTWRGRAFFISTERTQDSLVCADIRTGTPLWRRRLARNASGGPFTRNGRGPIAVSPDGVVFVQDGIPGTETMAAVAANNMSFSYGRSAVHTVLAFRAADGAPVAQFPSVLDRGPIPQLLLADGVGSQGVHPYPWSTQPLGPLLIQGSEVAASSLFDHLWRWTPNLRHRTVALAHLFPREPDASRLLAGEPLPPPALERAVQHAWPAVACAGGIITGSGFGPVEAIAQRQSLAFIAGEQCVWHRDYAWGLGIPCVERDIVFTGAGGGNGTQGIMAHDGRTGELRWTFAPRGLRPDTRGVAGGMSVATSSRGTIMRSGATPTFAALPTTHGLNPGLVLSGERLYGVVLDNVVALDTKTGQPIWSQPLGLRERVSTLVASPEYLLVGVHRTVGKETLDRLVALRLDSGKPVWSLNLPRAGNQLALSEGLLFSTDSSVHCFAPAERTFHLAVDSDRREDYDRQPPQAVLEEPAAKPPVAHEGENPPAAAAEDKRPLAVADASLLRLQWGEPAEELVRKVRERRAILGGKPLLLSLDWLDPTRTTIRGGHAAWDSKQLAAFTQLCERLAREATPDHFDVAPEVNVYLARDLRRIDPVRAVVQAAAAAVRRGSPATKVLVSFNRELMGGYGRGSHLPFGRVVMPRQSQQAELLALFEDVDEVGLTSCPQAAFNSPTEIPGDYFLALKPLFRKKPLLVTGLRASFETERATPEVEQASYLRHLVQCCYWLDAKLIAYPDVARPDAPESKAVRPAPGRAEASQNTMPDPSLRVGDRDRLGLAMWRDTLTWRRVTQLSAPAANLETRSR